MTATLARRLDAGLRRVDLPSRPERCAERVTERDIAPLPLPARRYLRFIGAVGRYPDWSFRARFTGRFRLGPDRRWMDCDARQYNTALGPARVFAMRLDGVAHVPLLGSDTYAHGRGRMDGRLLGIVPVARGAGERYDVGELTTYVDDALILAPTMLLGPATWSPIDNRHFDVTLADAGHRSTVRVTVDGDGALVDAWSVDRWCDLPGGPVRARWSTPVGGWRVHGGRLVPRGLRATWHLPTGPFTYVEGEFDPDELAWNVEPTLR